MKKLKQRVSLLLSLLMVLLAFGAVPAMAEETAPTTAKTPVTAVGDAGTVEVDGKTFIVVRTKAEFTEKVKTNDIIFGNDIDMGGEELTAAICNLNKTIDGNGFALVNFSLNGGTNSASLFNVAKYESAEIRNLDIGTEDQKIKVAGGDRTAVIFGSMLSELVDEGNRVTTKARCSAVLTNVNIYAEVTGGSCTGMIAGYVMGNLTLTNCNTYGSVRSDAQSSSGMIGKVEGNNRIKEPAHNILIDNSNNHASVTGSNINKGGMIGAIQPVESNMMTVEIRNSRNSGEINSSNNGSVGGMIGNVWGSSNWIGDFVCKLENCINNGAITGTANTGGLVGDININKTNSNSHVTIKDCVNTADITGSAGNSGGIMGRWIVCGSNGYTQVLKAENCVNLGDLKGTGDLKGGFAGHFENWTASTTISYFLNMGNINGAGGSAAGVLAQGNISSTTLEYCVNLGKITDVKTDGAGIYAHIQNDRSWIRNNISAGDITGSADSKLGYILSHKEPNKTINQQDDNRYMEIKNFNQSSDDCSATALKSWSELAALLNENYGSHWNAYFVVNEANDGLEMIQLPTFVGVQQSAQKDGTYSIRLVAVIDILDYSKVGFKIKLDERTAKNINCTTVYDKLLATGENNEMIEYTAAELGGKYIFALTVTGLKTNEKYTLEVTPYAEDLAETPVTITGEMRTVTFENGEFVPNAAPKI